MIAFPLREAWAKSFVRCPQGKDHKLMKLEESSNIALFVSGELFKTDSSHDQFYSKTPIYHVWIGDKWVYCGPDYSAAYAMFEKTPRMTKPK